MNMQVMRYSSELKLEWDKFILHAKNSHFMFYRDYMDYHGSRFVDYSLMFYNKDKLLAVMPANIENDVIYSHLGLTFGGLITSTNTRTIEVLLIFELMLSYLRENRFAELVYKCIPFIYSEVPADEDRYALFRNNAQLIRRDISTAIYLEHKIKYSELRRRSIKKAYENGITVVEQYDFSLFWQLLTTVLAENHKADPVHNLSEIQWLANKFPDNIRLFVALSVEQKILSGSVVYITNNVVHTQYLASNKDGREVGALDMVIDYLINKEFKNKKIFDFGTSNEDNGMYLNEGLITQKEGFGARGVVHDFYKIEIS